MEFWSFFFGPNSHRFVLKEGVKTSSCEPHLILHWNVDMCRSLILISMIHIYIYTWNLNGLYFWRSTPQNKAFSNQNKDYIHIIQILIVLPRSPLSQSYQESMILITPAPAQQKLPNGRSAPFFRWTTSFQWRLVAEWTASTTTRSLDFGDCLWVLFQYFAASNFKKSQFQNSTYFNHSLYPYNFIR